MLKRDAHILFAVPQHFRRSMAAVLQSSAGLAAIPLENDTAPSPPPLARMPDLPSTNEVRLHVYDFNRLTKHTGLRVYHLGVSVYNREFYFCGAGILSQSPGSHSEHIHKDSLSLGHTNKCFAEIKAILTDMMKEWKGESYSVIRRNCQSFAVSFVEQLGLASGNIPNEFRRHSDILGEITGNLLRKHLAGSLATRKIPLPSILLPSRRLHQLIASVAHRD